MQLENQVLTESPPHELALYVHAQNAASTLDIATSHFLFFQVTKLP